MRHSRFIILLLAAPALMADACDEGCCQTGSLFEWMPEGDCDQEGGTIVSEEGTVEECEARGAGGDTCATFCAAAESVCPGDTACEHSCENAPNDLTADAVACAQAASDCDSVNDCWGMLYQ